MELSKCSLSFPLPRTIPVMPIKNLLRRGGPRQRLIVSPPGSPLLSWPLIPVFKGRSKKTKPHETVLKRYHLGEIAACTFLRPWVLLCEVSSNLILLKNPGPRGRQDASCGSNETDLYQGAD
jgi:hypothetical protein